MLTSAGLAPATSNVISPRNNSRLAQTSLQFLQCPTQKLFVDLGDLSRQNGSPLRPKYLDRIPQRLHHSVWRFVENHGRLFVSQRFKKTTTLPSSRRRKSNKQKRRGIEARRSESRYNCRTRPVSESLEFRRPLHAPPRYSPGSEIPGIPASETKAIRAPPFSSATSSSARWRSLWAWQLTVGTPMPKCESSFCVWRVSSQATRSTLRKTRNARNVMSSRFPIGVATMYSPGASGFVALHFPLSKLDALNRGRLWPSAFQLDCCCSRRLSASKPMLCIRFCSVTMPTICSPSSTGTSDSPRPALMRRKVTPRESSGWAT